MLFAEDWNVVYLASFPRSGNHWVRFLVEEATHIATSSVYRDKDFPHLQHVFPWGGYCTDHGYEGSCRYPINDDPVLLKTHYPFLPRKIDPVPTSAVCLIRHPIDAFWSFNVYKRGHDATQLDKGQLTEFIQRWKIFYEFWITQPEVLFIRYEDLHSETASNLSLILHTVGYSFTQIDIDRAVMKYSPEGRPLKHMDRYDSESIETIKTELADLLMRFNYEI